MKILQLNIWGGKLGKKIKELVAKEQPDILCFQEVVKLPTRDTLFFSALQEYEDLGYHSFFSPVFGFSLMRQKAEFGNAILSKAPFTVTETIFTRKEYIDDIDMLEKDYNVRNLQHVVIESSGEKINILNHHGHHVHAHKNGDEETLRQTKMISDYVKNLDGKIILCGDFNLSPKSESLEQINKIIDNQCIKANVTTTRNTLTTKSEVCDYIFTSKDITPTRFEVLSDVVSDHSALVLEF
ncbi:hypothetical protein CL653_03925 [bacterium]|nr:hypothetical protein [bacterium]